MVQLYHGPWNPDMKFLWWPRLENVAFPLWYQWFDRDRPLGKYHKSKCKKKITTCAESIIDLTSVTARLGLTCFNCLCLGVFLQSPSMSSTSS